jgi:hypothetical protein
MSLDFRDVALYILLEAFGFGPQVTFLSDAYSAGSFHILTKGLSAEFSGDLHPVPEDHRLFSRHAVDFLELALIQLIFGLRDVHRDNCCLACDQFGNRRAMLIAFKHPMFFSMDHLPQDFPGFKDVLQKS